MKPSGLLHAACQLHCCQLHAFVLMTNHVHLLLTPDAPDAVSLVIRDVGRDYVRTINKAYRRTGTLWEGRFRSSLVDEEAYCLACYRYIEMNPVRAGMVRYFFALWKDRQAAKTRLTKLYLTKLYPAPFERNGGRPHY